jgi:hypothetical protein
MRNFITNPNIVIAKRMKQLSLVILIFALVISCAESESHKQLDVRKFNAEIANETTIDTPSELIKLFYKNYLGREGESTVITRTLDDGSFEIYLIADVKNDDSRSVEKIIMTASRQGKIWNVKEIKENWKCKGNTSWGTEPCK